MRYNTVYTPSYNERKYTWKNGFADMKKMSMQRAPVRQSTEGD
jgi:hypothetical protein